MTRILKVGSPVIILSAKAGGAIAGTGTASTNETYCGYTILLIYKLSSEK